MSRGLGAVQREILATLQVAKMATTYSKNGIAYAGCKTRFYHPLPYCAPGWVWYHRNCVWLADQVFDLRASSTYLKRWRGLGMQDCNSSFTSAFSRAIKTLLVRGIL